MKTGKVSPATTINSCPASFGRDISTTSCSADPASKKAFSNLTDGVLILVV